MGTYVKDGNQCIGCECLPEFPDLCTECTNLKPDVELVRVAEAMRHVLKEADEYLTSNKLNSIGSGSVLHRNMKDAVEGRAELPLRKTPESHCSRSGGVH